MVYALVASDCDFAVDVFVELAAAERALADVLADEPRFAQLLSVVALPHEESRAAEWIQAQAATS